MSNATYNSILIFTHMEQLTWSRQFLFLLLFFLGTNQQNLNNFPKVFCTRSFQTYENISGGHKRFQRTIWEVRQIKKINKTNNYKLKKNEK